MKAPATRRGGKHCAAERGANDTEPEQVECPPLTQIRGGPLVERLSNESRLALAEVCIANGLSIE